MKTKIEELSPITYESALSERKIALERLIKLKSAILERTRLSTSANTSTSQLKNTGRIRVVAHGKSLQYYLITKKGDTKGKYLSNSQKDYAHSLIKYDYEKKALLAMKNELAQITKLLIFCKKKSVEEIFERISKAKRTIIEPVTLPKEEFVKKWQSVPYVDKGFDYSSTEFYTSKGERVRSKSEVIIADTLARLKIPYRYEYPLELKNQSFPIYPDFCCLNLTNHKEIYWEHFGMMDDPEYAAKAVSKINSMEASGYLPGKNVIFTFETQTSPLNIKLLEKVIENYLS